MTVAEVTDQIEAERRLAVALKGYAGRWVAIEEHEVIADADSLDTLLEQTREKNEDDIVVFQVPEDQHTACFF